MGAAHRRDQSSGRRAGRRSGRALNRGEVYRSEVTEPERGGKPGYYVVVARDFIAANERVETVICAPVYSEVIDIPTEVHVDERNGVRYPSAIRCDFLMLLFKSRLNRKVGQLDPGQLVALDEALKCALAIGV
ncbi:MAG: type II toxin-antitoxin system PemK/MazF family toxin [Myxococcales bacterium]|nr:type II toxin-antitoxin system PemK/MazF family toxin [Myxococcales bacterium]